MPRQIGMRLLPLLSALLIAGAYARADTLDLKRVTPVPAGKPIPVVDFFRRPLMEDPAINRAGTYIAALYVYGRDNMGLMVDDLNRSKFQWLTENENFDIADFTWLDDTHLVFTVENYKSNQTGTFAANVEHLTSAYPILKGDGGVVVGVPDRDRVEPLIWLREDSRTDRQGGVAEVNSLMHHGGSFEVVNQKHILKTYPIPGGGLVTSYLTNKDGELAFAITSKNGYSTLHRFTGDHWVTCPVDLDKITIEDCGNKPDQLVVLGPRGTGHPRPLEFMDAATGRAGAVLLKLLDHDFYGWLYREPVHHLIVGAEYETNGPQSTWFVKAYADLQKMLMKSKVLSGRVVRILGSDLSQKRYLISAFSDRQPTSFYLVDMAKHSLELLKDSRPWIDPARMQPMETMRYRTRDGRYLDAYVTLPKGASKAHPAPLLVLPHNPFTTTRDSWGFDPEVQFFASRGYAVLQPNFRGSAGYNWEFTLKQEFDFREMSDDITDATKALLTTGYIDPKRVGIMGTGLGGAYLALSGAVFDPNLYRCCVLDDGMFDWSYLMKDQKYYRYDSPFYSSAVRFVGNPNTDREKFAAVSPLRHVDRMKAAAFVDYARNNTVTPSQAHQLLSELEKYKIPHEEMEVGTKFRGREYLIYQVKLFTRIEAFLAKYLGS